LVEATSARGGKYRLNCKIEVYGAHVNSFGLCYSKLFLAVLGQHIKVLQEVFTLPGNEGGYQLLTNKVLELFEEVFNEIYATAKDLRLDEDEDEGHWSARSVRYWKRLIDGFNELIDEDDTLGEQADSYQKIIDNMERFESRAKAKEGLEAILFCWSLPSRLFSALSSTKELLSYVSKVSFW
jgi:hypothetical protein